MSKPGKIWFRFCLRVVGSCFFMPSSWMFSYPDKLNIITRVLYKSLCPPWKALLSWRSNLKNQPFTTRTPPSYKVVCSRINGEFKHIPTINLTLILANLNQILHRFLYCLNQFSWANSSCKLYLNPGLCSLPAAACTGNEGSNQLDQK